MSQRRSIGRVKALVAMAAFLSLSVVATAAGLAGLVKQINTSTGSSSPQEFVEANGLLFFNATTGETGRELYKMESNGRVSLIKDLAVGTGSTNPVQLKSMGSNVYFQSLGTTQNPTLKLYKTDGTDAGTSLVYTGKYDRFLPPSPTGYSQPMAVVGSTLYFAMADDEHGQELWKSDGTPAGTMMVADINTGTASSAPQKLTPHRGFLYFWADTASGRTLHKSDGTTAGTVSLGITSFDGQLLSLGENLIYTSAPGTPGVYGVYSLVGDSTTPEALDYTDSFNLRLKILDGYLFILENDEILWSDGTAAGTTLYGLLLGNEGYTPSSLSDMAMINGKFLFLGAYDLWSYEAGNVTSISPAIGAGLVVTTDRVAFRRRNETTFTDDLWVSDGTMAGTTRLGAAISNTKGMVPTYGTGSSVSSKLYLPVGTPRHNIEPWIVDGTHPAGQIIADVNKTPVSSAVSAPIAYGDGVVFEATNQGVIGLYISDGSSMGTRLIKAGAGDPMIFNDRIIFTYADAEHGLEYWITDANGANPHLLKDINPGADGGAAYVSSIFTVVGNQAFFMGYDPDHGNELWRTDGTEEGTRLVKDIVSGLAGEWIYGGAVMGDHLYFTHSTTGVWKTDGTEAGTVKVFSNIAPDLFTFSDSKMLWVEKHVDDQWTVDLCSWDGTPTGKTLLRTFYGYTFELTVAGNHAFYYDMDSLCCTDGTPAGTVTVKPFNETRELIALGDKVFFYGEENSSTSGMEPWISDGTAGGTFMLKDVYPGATGVWGGTSTRCASETQVFFEADDSVNGEEIWCTDGTSDGTQLYCETLAGAAAQPFGLSWAGNRLFVNTGELKAYPVKAPDQTASETVPTGDSAPIMFGLTGVSADFTSNTIENLLWINRFPWGPPFLTRAHLQVCWEIEGLSDSAFETMLTFRYTDAEVAAAGLTEDQITIMRSDDGGVTWVEVPSVIDPVNNTISTQNPQSQFSLWGIADAQPAASVEMWESE